MRVATERAQGGPAPAAGDERLPREGEVIRTVDLRKVYDTGAAEVRAMDGVNLVIRTNEYVAFMGPSGSAKSTLMILLVCLDTPATGHDFSVAQEGAQLPGDERSQIRNPDSASSCL